MGYKISAVGVWVADVLNRPGRLARLLEVLASAGAELEFVISRRVTANTSRVFLAPLKTAAQRKAAASVDVVPAAGLHTLRIDGPNQAALGARLTRALADKDIAVRGLSAAVQGKNCVTYIAFQTDVDAKAALRVLKKNLSSRK